MNICVDIARLSHAKCWRPRLPKLPVVLNLSRTLFQQKFSISTHADKSTISPTMKERLSKRCRPSTSPEFDDKAPAINAMEIFRRHFESRFESIDETPAVPYSNNFMVDEGSGAEDEEWSGISGSEESEAEADTVQVVHHTSARIERPQMSKRALREFMVPALSFLVHSFADPASP